MKKRECGLVRSEGPLVSLNPILLVVSEKESEGESDEEENEVLEESPCGRWRKLRSKVRNQRI